jgi:hypothetical protein
MLEVLTSSSRRFGVAEVLVVALCTVDLPSPMMLFTLGIRLESFD